MDTIEINRLLSDASCMNDWLDEYHKPLDYGEYADEMNRDITKTVMVFGVDGRWDHSVLRPDDFSISLRFNLQDTSRNDNYRIVF